jgi:SAM-dependent methyltransferase
MRNGRHYFAPESASEGDGYDKDYFERLVQLEEHYFWFVARNRLIEYVLARFFSDATHLCEIGCGNAGVLSYVERCFPYLELTGGELFEEGLGYASGRLLRSTLYQMDARTIPFTEEFDVIGAFDVIEHIEEDRDVLREIHRALKPNGGLIVTVPQHRWLWSGADTYAHHQRRYTRGELLTKSTDAGFDVIMTTSFVSLLLPVMLAARRLRSARKPYDLMAEFDIPKWLNKILLGGMGIERALIKAGLRFPLGGSLLLVARKNPLVTTESAVKR